MEATAPALAEQVVEAPPEPNLDADLAAIFDKNEAASEPLAEQVEEEPADEKPTDEPAAETPVAEDVDVPSDLPKALKDSWKDIPDAARRAFLDSQREMSRKLGDNGRLMQGLKPIQDKLTEAVKQFPALANEQPAQVAERVFALAALENKLRTNPDQGAAELAKQYPELARAVAGHVTGNPQSQDLLAQANHRINQLEQTVRRYQDPQYFREQFSQLNSEAQLETQVQKFAQTAEHWADVEATMPAAVQYVQQSQPNASAEDVLKAAYDLEVRRLGKAPAAVEAALMDPEKTEKALKAKSVNVKSQPSGKTRVKTEDELLGEVFDRNQS